MAVKIDIIAPTIEKDSSALTLVRWLKEIGAPVFQNEPIVEVRGAQVAGYVHSPAEGTLSMIFVGPNQNVLSGARLGSIAVIQKNAIDWGNFDQVAAILEEFAEKSKDLKQLKDANEALGQLLGVADKDVFTRMSIEQQNKFLQNVVDQYSQNGLSPADVAQKLLEGLQLRTPQLAPATPAPVYGISAPTPGGMGGGASRNPHQQQWPQHSLDHGYPPVDPRHGGVQSGHAAPPPHVPHIPPAPLKDDENK